MIAQFPRSAAYIKACGVKLDDPGLLDIDYAIILAEEAFTDEELVAAGTVDFGSGPLRQRDGTAILAALDALLRNRPARHKAKPVRFLADAEFEALKAYFGSRGVKASRLVTHEDFYSVAEILWPEHVVRSERLDDLLSQIRAMTKKQRQSARSRLHLVPKRFLPFAAQTSGEERAA
jgi:hypothetical protein